MGPICPIRPIAPRATSALSLYFFSRSGGTFMRKPLLLFLATLIGCTSAPVRSLPDGYAVAVLHSSGGPAPYVSWLGIYPNGDAFFRASDGRLRRIRVSNDSFARIQSLLARSDLRPQLSNLTARSQPYSDYEEVAFLIGDQEYRFVCREVPPEGVVLEFVQALRAVSDLRHGNRPFLSPECTSEPPESASAERPSSGA